ncbi:class I SAM-dependent methyltransferase [Corynebacterium antarcticum]|uniref:class I SAM-dependent methyltransferase n=1 Tax=Corynebacterium antarcticum TaxID=2800405 RepID=UPI0022608B17|nr:class I SAM-dependent methyltransferase [Corynebacterium antarcticum]MCX7540958.1 class I SAM-dependent methyltransferase [Corynebacterium antarcticum]
MSDFDPFPPIRPDLGHVSTDPLDSALVTDAESAAANRAWWDSDAAAYHREHAAYLGTDSPVGEFHWCPEMLHERDVRLLGGVRSASVLEIGCGSAPCARWLAADGVGFITAFDLSRGMLERADSSGVGRHGVALVQADAMHLPYRDASFNVAFSAFGAIPFVSDSAGLMREVARVLVPGGRFVFAVNHPMRWIFPDDPGEEGLTAYISYFDRSGYVERDPDTREVTYAEQHRTIGDRIRELIGAGFVLDDLIEPEWPDDLTETWGQWSPLRGNLFPGTAIFVAHLPR